jgi:hypothetical protein
MAELITITGIVIAFLSSTNREVLRAGAISFIVLTIIFSRKSVRTKIMSGLENKY